MGNIPVNETQSTTLLKGDCLEQMRSLLDNSIDSIVTDPPYALTGTSGGSGGFMGQKWDSDLPTVEMWKEALRVAKPGAHLLAFGGTRTYHRLACAIEDAGWEIKDCCFWCHGQGFPKGQNVSKQVEALLKTGKTNSRSLRKVEQDGDGAPYQIKGRNNGILDEERVYDRKEFLPETKEAKAWEGWNTSLKPAVEPIVIARKPLEGTVAANVLKYGTGAINIDGCRIPLAEDDKLQDGVKHDGKPIDTQKMGFRFKNLDRASGLGRFPANLIHDGSPEVIAHFPDSKGQCGAVKGNEPSELTNGIYGKYNARLASEPRNDSGSAARFFYCAKASRSERGEGNIHPTVKPLALMRYLVRLVTRKGGIVLDPFMGSGTTGVAALQEGMNFVGIEREPHYFEIASKRILQKNPSPPKEEETNAITARENAQLTLF